MKRGRGEPGTRWLRGVVIALLLGGLSLASGPGAGAQTVPPPGVLPRQPGQTVPEYVPGQVVVLFQPGRVPLTEAGANSQVERTLAAADVRAAIEARLEDPNGFVLTLTSAPTEIAGEREAAALAALRARPEVRAADLNFVRTLHATPNDPGYPNQWAYRHIAAPAAWDTPQALGVTVAVLDTGLDMNHPEFRGRIAPGYDYVNNDPDPSDDNGHGTHVAGTVGGKTYGVAQNVALVAVRVLGCSGSGSTSGVIAGIDWVTQNHAPKAVANMSLGGGFSSTLNAAVTGSVKAGVTYAVAAGNSNADACNSSPSSAAAALTVGATTSSDAKASFSNWGKCVDLNAPGVSITSSWNTSDVALASASGTSMASPHVAGAAALYLSGHPGSTPAEVESALKAAATTNHVTGLPNDTPNLLLYTHFDAGSTPPPPSGPVAAISKSCSGFTCTFTSVGTATGTPTYAWTHNGGTQQGGNTSATYVVSYAPRQGGSVTLVVTDANGTSVPATASVTCNPKKCQ